MIPLLIVLCFQASIAEAGFFKKLGEVAAHPFRTAKIAAYYGAGAAGGAFVGGLAGFSLTSGQRGFLFLAGPYMFMGAFVGAMGGILLVANRKKMAADFAADFQAGYNKKD